MLRPIFILCEGVQDVYVLGSFLNQAGVRPYKKKLLEYPVSVGNILRARYGQRDVDSAQFRGQDVPLMDEVPLFTAAYANESALFLFFTAKGNHEEDTKEFIGTLVDLASDSTPRELRLPPFGLMFVRDADSIRISERVLELHQSFRDVLMPILPNFHGCAAQSLIENNGFSAAICVFAEPGKDCGVLEHLLDSVLADHHGERWVESSTFVKKFSQAGTKLAKSGSSAVRLKATLTIAGQPICPGFSQAVVLRETLNAPLVVPSLLKLDDCLKIQKLMLRLAGLSSFPVDAASEAESVSRAKVGNVTSSSLTEKSKHKAFWIKVMRESSLNVTPTRSYESFPWNPAIRKKRVGTSVFFGAYKKWWLKARCRNSSPTGHLRALLPLRSLGFDRLPMSSIRAILKEMDSFDPRNYQYYQMARLSALLSRGVSSGGDLRRKLDRYL